MRYLVTLLRGTKSALTDGQDEVHVFVALASIFSMDFGQDEWGKLNELKPTPYALVVDGNYVSACLVIPMAAVTSSTRDIQHPIPFRGIMTLSAIIQKKFPRLGNR